MPKERPQSGIIIENEHRQVLLQRRDNKGTIPFPNLLGTFGGEIKPGESPEQCLEREVREELQGYDPLGFEYWRMFHYDEYEIHMFIKKEPHLDLTRIRITEGQGAEWITEQYAKEHEGDFAFNSREIVLTGFVGSFIKYNNHLSS